MGVPFWGPDDKDYDILGSIMGSPFRCDSPYGEFYGSTRPLSLESLNPTNFRISRTSIWCSIFFPIRSPPLYEDSLAHST